MIIPHIGKFKNINGVTCYMNSILHILQQIEPFIKYVNSNLYLDILNTKDSNKKWLIIELSELIKLSIHNNDSVITPNRFRKCIGYYDDMWLDNIQQDSSDFLGFLLSKLEEEVGINTYKIPKLFNYNNTNSNLISAYKSYINFYSKEYSPIKKMFTGFNKYNKICGYCNKESIKYEPNNILHLSIPDTHSDIELYDCFNYFITKTKMSNDNLYNCESCKNKTFCYDQTLLWHLPNIIIISLKRFNNNMQKNNTNIIYPENNFNLSKYFDKETPHAINNNYELIAVNLHYSGNSINYGHYVSVIKNNNKWFLYDDSNPVIKVKSPQFKEAYLLFYKINI